MNRAVMGVVVAVVCGGVTSCHWFEDVENIENCPLNSRYPCPCDVSCEDDHVCRRPEGAPLGYGQCTVRCGELHSICEQSTIAHYAGICLESGYCATYCVSDDNCPPGMGCGANKTCVPGLSVALGDTEQMYPQDSEDAGLASGDTDPAVGTDEQDTLFLQREEECKALIEKTFECFPDQDEHREAFIRSCLEEAWHSDPCGACQLACDLDADCDTVGICLTACDESSCENE